MDVDRKCNDTWIPTCHEESPGPSAVIIISSLLGLSTVLVVALIFIFLHKHKRGGERTLAHFTNGLNFAGGEENGQQSVSLTPVNSPRLRTALSSWEIPPECVLGSLEFWQPGRYGPVCKGLLRDKDGASSSSSAVVVKSLREGHKASEAEEFAEWLHFHATVCKHENVVQMLCCRTRCAPMFLVLEEYRPGNLLHFLWTLRTRESSPADPQQDFSERSVFLVAKQVAAGLDYLMSEHRLVHGDVAARNILLGPGLSARVSGLGAAFQGRRMDSSRSQRAAEEEEEEEEEEEDGLPVKWKAPERIMMRLSIDRSDVWSFGILLYELVTLGSPPYPELDAASVLPKLQASYRMKRPKNCGGPLYDLMKYCWMWSFKDRPTFSAIMKLLESSLHFAATGPIIIPDVIDISEYNTQAGLQDNENNTEVQ